MSSTGTLVSQWVGTCLTVPDKGDPEFLPSAGLTINGSPNIFSNIGTDGKVIPQARLGDLTIGPCAATGMIIAGSPDVFGNIGTDGKVIPKALVGSLVFGGNIGLIITGDVTHFIDPPETE